MTSPHQDAADLVVRLEEERKLCAIMGDTTAHSFLGEISNLIEQQVKALSEAEALAEERLQNYRKGMSVVRDLNMRHKRELADILKSAANTFEAYREVELRALAAEAERDTLRARLKEAEMVIEPFAAQFALIECTSFHGIDDNGTWPVDEDQVVQISHLRAARSFLNSASNKEESTPRGET